MGVGTSCHGQEEKCEKEDLAIIHEEVVKEDKPSTKEVASANEPADLNESNPQKELEPAKEKEPEQAPEPAKDAERIKVHIAACKNIREVSWVPKTGSDMYIVLRLESSDEELFRTDKVKDQVWPTWKEEKYIYWTPGENLEFELVEVLYDSYDMKGQMKSEQTVVAARGVLKSSDFAKSGFVGTIPMDSRVHLDTILKVRVAAPGKDYPPDPPTEFTLTFDKAGNPGRLGLHVDQSDGQTLCVREVEKGGTVWKYNKEAPEDQHVRPQDFIMKVNEVEGNSAELLKELSKDTKIHVVVRRPMALAMGVAPKQLRALNGIELSKIVDQEWLLIEGVKTATNAYSYNEAFADNQIKKGDRMVRVFGTRAGFGCDLARTAASSASLQMEVFRPWDPKVPLSCWDSLGERIN